MSDLDIPGLSSNGGAGSVNTPGVRAPDYRQVVSPAEVDSFGAARAGREFVSSAEMRARELSNVFGEASNDLNAVAARAGAKAGAAAGAAGNGAPLTGLQSIGAYGDAYAAAAHVTYVNNVQSHAEDTLTQIEQDTPADPISFQTRAQAVAAAAVKQAPAIYQPEVAQMYQLRIQAGITRLRGQAVKQTRADALDSYTSTVDSRIATAVQTASALPAAQQQAVMSKLGVDNQAQLDLLVKAHAISATQATILQQKFQDAAVAAVHQNYTTSTVDHMMDLARAGDVEAADKALHQYLIDPANADDDKQRVTQEYLKQADAFHQAQSRAHANDIANVGQQLAAGKFGADVEPQIHSLYKNGSLTPEGLHSMLDQSMRNQVSSITDDSSNQMIDAAVHGTGPKLDPADKTTVKAADTYFRTHIAISGVPPLSDAWTAGAASFARQTNIIPPTVLSQIRVGLVSGDPTMAVRAAAAAERIRAANPNIDPYANDPRSAALANEINANLHAGMKPQQAYQVATQTVDRDEGSRKVIAQNYTQLLKQDPQGNAKALQSALDAATPGLFAHAPPAPVGMQAEYTRLVSTYYGLNQNINAARALAARQVQTTWGVSRMNGQPELVKYPPERLGVSAEMIRADVASSVKAAGYTGDPSQIHLVPNAETDASGGRVWTLTHVDPQTGMTDVLLDKRNQPLVYHVPVGQDFAKTRQALINQKLDAARAERDEQRKNSADQIMFEQQLANEYLTPANHGLLGAGR